MKSIGMKMMRQDSNETESFRAKGRRKISRDEYISVHPDDSDEDSSERFARRNAFQPDVMTSSRLSDTTSSSVVSNLLAERERQQVLATKALLDASRRTSIGAGISLSPNRPASTYSDLLASGAAQRSQVNAVLNQQLPSLSYPGQISSGVPLAPQLTTGLLNQIQPSVASATHLASAPFVLNTGASSLQDPAGLPQQIHPSLYSSLLPGVGVQGLQTSQANPALTQGLEVHGAQPLFIPGYGILIPTASAPQSLMSTLPPLPTASCFTQSDDADNRDSPILKGAYDYSPGRGEALALPSDAKCLSDYQRLVREQIDLFEAKLEDVDCNAQGRNKPIVPGQIGIRCKHCAHLHPNQRKRGSVYFPAKMTGLYQAAQNMAINHFLKSCETISDSTREALKTYKEKRSTVLGGGKQYWANGVRVLGVREGENGLEWDKNKKRHR